MRDMVKNSKWRKANYQKNKEHMRKRQRAYYWANHEKCLEINRKSWSKHRLKNNKKRNALYNKKGSSFRKKCLITYKNRVKAEPWFPHFRDAKSRCLNKNNSRFYRYGGRGIKFKMTKDDFKLLWNRDKAFNMKKPSIDRVNNNSHYRLSNCRFIEMSLNTAKGNKERAYSISIK